MRRTLIIMVKEPRLGRVKTRLAKDIGAVEAVWWFRHQVQSLVRKVADPRWHVVLAVAPDRGGIVSRALPSGFERVPQGPGDLGDRMARLLRMPAPGPVCLIGADIPEVGAEEVARAFAKLGAADAVFGPAMDGGYWLVGLKRVRAAPPGFLADVRWSSAHALAESVATLTDHRIAYADRLRDVDSGDDLRMTRAARRASRPHDQDPLKI